MKFLNADIEFTVQVVKLFSSGAVRKELSAADWSVFLLNLNTENRVLSSAVQSSV